MKRRTTDLVVGNPISRSLLQYTWLRFAVGNWVGCLGFVLVLLLLGGRLHAGSATWSPAPGSGDWNTAANWVAGGPPNGPLDTATFAISTQTAVSISANTEVNGITFNVAASAFTITAKGGLFLTISGTGITNNSGITQNFVAAVGSAGADGFIHFTNSATAGSMTVFTNNGGRVSGGDGGETYFDNTSTAGNGTFTNNGGTVGGAGGGFMQFLNSSTAGSGTFTNNGGAVDGANGGFMQFLNSSTAGNGTFTTNGNAVQFGNGGSINFFDSSTAGNGTFTTNGGLVSGSGCPGCDSGRIQFDSTSTAGNGTFTNNGGTVSGAFGGQITFLTSSTAGNGTFTNNGGTVSGAFGGGTSFFGTSTAGSGTFIINGGTVSGAFGGQMIFLQDSTGGTARVEVFGNGNLDIFDHNAPGVTIGSIEGSGNVFLGANNLTVGSNNLSTTFSGVIQDGLDGGMGGSLTKIGTGTLSLTNANTYTGGTLINAGTLIVGHDGALGSGNVSLTAAGVTLTLQGGATNNYISDHSSISIVNGAIAKLNFTGASDVVGGIVLNGLIETAPGTYGSATSGAMFQSAFFSGTGTLLLIPEPSTWTMMGLGLAMLAAMRFRRRRG